MDIKESQAVATGGRPVAARFLMGLHTGGSGCLTVELANWAGLRRSTGGIHQTSSHEQPLEAGARRGSIVAGAPVKSCLKCIDLKM